LANPIPSHDHQEQHSPRDSEAAHCEMLYPKSFFALVQGRLPDGEGTSVLLQFAFEGVSL
jgi:hypothetical protein